jgi:hypothetical protein
MQAAHRHAIDYDPNNYLRPTTASSCRRTCMQARRELNQAKKKALEKMKKDEGWRYYAVAGVDKTATDGKSAALIEFQRKYHSYERKRQGTVAPPAPPPDPQFVSSVHRHEQLLPLKRSNDSAAQVVSNVHRQEYAQGQPLMSRLLRGEFYASGPHRQKPQSPDFVAINRGHVRVSSDSVHKSRLVAC